MSASFSLFALLTMLASAMLTMIMYFIITSTWENLFYRINKRKWYCSFPFVIIIHDWMIISIYNINSKIYPISCITIIYTYSNIIYSKSIFLFF